MNTVVSVYFFFLACEDKVDDWCNDEENPSSLADIQAIGLSMELNVVC